MGNAAGLKALAGRRECGARPRDRAARRRAGGRVPRAARARRRRRGARAFVRTLSERVRRTARCRDIERVASRSATEACWRRRGGARRGAPVSDLPPPGSPIARPLCTRRSRRDPARRGSRAGPREGARRRGYFVVATAWSWFRFRQREARRDRWTEAARDGDLVERSSAICRRSGHPGTTSTRARGRRRRRCGCCSTTSTPRSPSIPSRSSSTAARGGPPARTTRSAGSCARCCGFVTTRRCSSSPASAVGVFRTHAVAPRVLIANSLLVPALGDVARVQAARGRGPDDVRPDDRRARGSTSAHRESSRGRTRRSARRVRRTSARPTLAAGRCSTAGLGGMGGAQPLAATMAGAAILCVEVDQRSIDRRLRDALPRRAGRDARRRARARARGSCRADAPLSVAVLGERGRRLPGARRARRGVRPRHRPDGGARPAHRATSLPRCRSRRRRALRRARPRPSTCGSLRSRSSRTSARWSSSSGWGATFSIMATTCEVRPIERPERRLHIPGLRPGLYPAALLPRHRAVPLGGALRRPRRHRGDRPRAEGAVPRRRAASALARAGAREGRVPGAAGPHLLARLRRPCARRPRDQRARALRARVARRS